MSNLTIYDSQGERIQESVGQRDERIENFFFNQVRLAIDRSGQGCEIICFFRARTSRASRSEQYYAVFQDESWQQAQRRFKPELERVVEEEYGLSFVTTTDDTSVFEYLFGTETFPSTPPKTSLLDDVVEMVLKRNGLGSQTEVESDSLGSPESFSHADSVELPSVRQAHIGTGSYLMGINVATYLFEELDSFIITNTSNGPEFDVYDAVIEKTPDVDVQLLGETAKAYQTYQDRIAERRQQMQAAQQSADDPQEGGSAKPLAVAVLGVVGVVVIGIYVACFFGAPLPDAVPGCSGSSDIDVTVDEVVLDDEELHVGGTVTDGGERVNRTDVQILVCEGECSGGVYIHNETVTIDNGSVDEQFQTGSLDLTEGEVYYVAIRYEQTLSESKPVEVSAEPLEDTSVDGPGNAVDDGTGDDTADDDPEDDTAADDPGDDDVEGEITQTPKWVQTSENETVTLHMRGDLDLIGNDKTGETIDLTVEDGARNWSGRTEITENDFDFEKHMIPANNNIRSDDGPTRIIAEHTESGISNTIIIGKYIPTVTPSENNKNDINITVTNRDSQNEDILDLSVYDQNETELYSERVQMSVGEDDRMKKVSDITVDEVLVVVEYDTHQDKEIHKEVVLEKEE